MTCNTLLQEYVFKVQATTLQGHDEDRLITVGKAKIDIAQYAVLGHKEHETVLQMPFTAGKSFIGALPFGQLRLKISAHMVKVYAACFLAPTQSVMLQITPIHEIHNIPFLRHLCFMGASSGKIYRPCKLIDICTCKNYRHACMSTAIDCFAICMHMLSLHSLVPHMLR